MEQLIEDIRKRLDENAYTNEAAVSFSILMPILRSLGWDDSNPEQVIPEYSTGARRVDFALCKGPRRPVIFIEVKSVGRAIEGDRQLFEYAFHEGIPFCLLTDGREWNFYLPGGHGTYEERRVYRLQLNERSPTDSADILKRYLSRERVQSGDALEDSMRDHRDIASRREASRSLPKAWDQLVEEPEDLLVELLGDQTESVSGYRPSTNEITDFLKLLTHLPQKVDTRSNQSIETNSPTIIKSNLSKKVEKSIPYSQGGKSRRVKYHVFGEMRDANNASGALVDILSTIANRYPEKLSEVAKAVRGRSRNHIARTVVEIYPARPDLARAEEFTPGWLVGLNIANREKIRIIRITCEVIGVKFGSDIKINLPNSN